MIMTRRCRKKIHGFLGILLYGLMVSTQVIAQTEATSAVKPYNMVLQTLVGLLIITGVIVACAWLAKHLGLNRFTGSKYLQVVATIPLGSREKAVLLEVGQEYILLGVAPGCVNPLQKFSKEDLEISGDSISEEPVAVSGKFAQKLSEIMNKN